MDEGRKFSSLLKRKSGPKNPSGIIFSQAYTHGTDLAGIGIGTTEIMFENRNLGIKRKIIDESGMIMNFPGIAYPNLIAAYTESLKIPYVNWFSYITSLEKHNAFIWQVQPCDYLSSDQQYIKKNPGDQIELFSLFDDNGLFIQPFHLFSIGRNELYNSAAEEDLAATLNSEDNPSESFQNEIPLMLDQLALYLKKGLECSKSYNIPGTVLKVTLTLQNEGTKWFVDVSVKKRFSNTSKVGYLWISSREEQLGYLKSEQVFKDIETEIRCLLGYI